MLYKNHIISNESRLLVALSKLDSNNPAKILAKSVCRIEKDKKPVLSVKNTNIGDSLDIYFSDGLIKATVTEKNEGGKNVFRT